MIATGSPTPPSGGPILPHAPAAPGAMAAGGQPIGAPAPQGPAPPPPQQIFDAQTFAMACQLMQDERQRGFRIDVETDSTVAVDQEGEQKSAMEMVKAVGGFMQSAMPMMQSIPQSIPLFGKILLFLLRRFPIGMELEGAFQDTIEKLEGMDPSALHQMMGANGPNAGKQQIMQIKQQIAQGQMQANQAKTQAEIQKAQLAAQASAQDHQVDLEGHAMDMRLESLKAQVDMQRTQMEAAALGREQQAAQADHARAMAEAAMGTGDKNRVLQPQRMPFMKE